VLNRLSRGEDMNIDNKYSILNKMPVDKFGRTDEKVVQHTPTVTSSIGLTMGQINNTFLRRDGRQC
jgi:hypothetical protein